MAAVAVADLFEIGAIGVGEDPGGELAVDAHQEAHGDVGILPAARPALDAGAIHDVELAVQAVFRLRQAGPGGFEGGEGDRGAGEFLQAFVAEQAKGDGLSGQAAFEAAGEAAAAEADIMVQQILPEGVCHDIGDQPVIAEDREPDRALRVVGVEGPTFHELAVGAIDFSP